MTAADRQKQRLATFIRQVWDEGDVEAADDHIAEASMIRLDPGAP